MSKTVFVYDGWSSPYPILIGRLFIDSEKKEETYSFEYDENWLTRTLSSSIDPDLSLYSGRQFPLNKKMFGIFSDSCPDRWGRLLIQRREAVRARKESAKPKKLEESDYLLGVYDESRMGGLRFSLDEGNHFESSDSVLAIPPLADLRSLEAASYAFENDESGLNEKWINQLIAPGSSLGGARPKASVKDSEGNLWIAKFPSRHDKYNSGAWEIVVHDLAILCGLNVPEAKLENFSERGSTFLVKRFDRKKTARIHFASAMAMLGKTDGDSDAGYLDLVSFIKTSGSNPNSDIRELWKRIVFSMAVSNTDDHLRNHGFIFQNGGWRLSPMYDVNPVPYGNSLSLKVDDSDSGIDLNLALSAAELYGIDKAEATSEADAIVSTVSANWKRLARHYGLTSDAMEYMRPAFNLS